MRLNFTANSFVFGRTNRENAPRSFFTNLARRLLPKCVETSRQTASFLDAKFRKMCPELFLQSVQDENFQNASELHSKLLHFWTHKSCNSAQSFFCKTCSQRSSEIRLNFTANNFVVGRTNRGIAPRTFSVRLAGRELPECL